jgi:hypothetical protein
MGNFYVKKITFLGAKIFYTRAYHPGRFNVTATEVLAGLKESNFVCGKTLSWNLLSRKHCIFCTF